MDVITRVAGTGVADRAGGPLATEADLNNPMGMAMTADGGFLIADTGNHVVRRVSAAGVITRVAGTFFEGNSGDGGLAADAHLHSPQGVAVTADGGLLIVDRYNSVVRMVSVAG